MNNLQDKAFYQDNSGIIINADCFEILPLIPDNSIDLIITDPPYGMRFMGKEWDKAVPSIEIWKECLRVLKDGAFAFIMCIPRQDCLARMIVNIEDAGFNVSFTSIYWVFASGFPKALNITKGIEAKLKIGKSNPSAINRMELNKISGQIIEKIQPNCGILGNKRRVVKKINTEIEDDKAREYDGSFAGFQPKPAVEVIIVAMKPLSEKSYVEQALKNKKGITWLDNCRIPYGESYFESKTEQTHAVPHSKGRFPANILVSDDILCLESKGAIAPVRSGQKGFGGIIYGKYRTGGDDGASFYSDKESSLSFSRYFDLDKWFENKIKELPEKMRDFFPFLICPKASKSEKEKGLEKSKNFHPTVKPITLFSWLCTLGSMENDTILDPFVGSGTTAIACKMLSRRYIGIEISKEYCEIAKKRLQSISEVLF